jgi:hypothetical protein
MDRKQYEEENKLIAEAGWILTEMLKPTFVFRMARGRLSTLYRDTPNFQERSARTRLVNAAREIVKLRDRWNHRVCHNSEVWQAMFDILWKARGSHADRGDIAVQTDMVIDGLRSGGYRITKRESE